MPAHATNELSRLTRALIGSLDGPELTAFFSAWPPDGAVRSSAVQPLAAHASARSVPVLQWLPHIAAGDGFAADLLRCLVETAPLLAWRQTYGLTDVAADFLQRYAYTELVGPEAPLSSAHIACGFLLLGPDTFYPRHRHPAEEIYVTLSGNARWLQGDAVWREHPAGRVSHHRSDETHAMQTGIQPLLALYMWRGRDLDQKARLVEVDASTA